jgi:hypothetical protein
MSAYRVAALFDAFMDLKEIEAGEGFVFDNVPLWISSRKKAYEKYRDRLASTRVTMDENWCYDFRDFLYFKHNQSWTTLYRRGLEALSEPEKLREMLILIQDESIDIGRRVRESLDGEYKCRGVGKNIVSALLHTFNPDKYGVWNTKTDETLKTIGRMPIMISDAGRNYVAINEKLKALATELNTDLTTIDGFMWFVSKD